jgi:NAD(P)-dependent dehydrogenase (short-subunit alcohol dehydrogenase family)
VSEADGALAGRVALVTGGAAGIGLGIVEALARAGASVAIADIDEAGAAAVAGRLSRDGRQHRAYCVDVTRAADVDAAVEATVRDLGGLDVLVNNAGVARIGAHTQDVTDEDWHASIAVMQHGVFYGMRAAGRVMVAQGSGSVVNIASIRAFSPNPGRLAYCAAKGAVVQMTRVAAVEWGPSRVRVNAIAPGVIRTEMWDSSVASGHLDEAHYLQTVPLGRIGDTQDVGELAAYLASDRARYVTGATFTVDGGLTCVPAG